MTEPPDLEVIELDGADRDDNAGLRSDAAAETLRRRRGPVVFALVIIVALVGVTIASNTQHSSRRASSPTTDASHTNIDLNDQPGAAAPLFPFHVGAQILTGGGNGLRLFDTDTGRVTTPSISGLPPGPVTVVAHSGATVAVRADVHLYWFTLPNGVAHEVDADSAFASTRPGHLWLAGQGFATEVPGDNDRLPRTRVTTRGPAIGATSAGLLVLTLAGIELEPSTGAGPSRVLLRAPATLIGVHADRVAWVGSDCGVLRCPVRITEIANGATSTWVQLVGRPSPLSIAGTSAVFSPDGGSLAIVEPNETVTAPSAIVVANLRTRATIVVAADRQFEQPARPGRNDATGMTLGWTPDGRYVVLGAPGPGADRVGVVDPSVPAIVPSGRAFAAGTSAAAVGVSSLGPRDISRRATTVKIDTGGPTALNLAGLDLVGADAHQVDVFDLDRDRVTTFAEQGPIPNAAGPNSIARVVGGWLVVRAGATDVVVDLLPDGGGPPREIGQGDQVFSSGEGRHAWIVDVVGSTVRSYDPQTGTLAHSVDISGQMVAVDPGLVVRVETGSATRLDIIAPSGRIEPGPLVASPSINLLAGAGGTIVYTDQNGLHAYDVSGQRDVVLSQAPVAAATLSPNGRQIAWIENGVTGVRVLATRLDSTAAPVILGGPADRVLVADNGTVLYINGAGMRRGRVDAGGSSPVSGYAPAPSASIALG